jgi:hypothetical protein
VIEAEIRQASGDAMAGAGVAGFPSDKPFEQTEVAESFDPGS